MTCECLTRTRDLSSSICPHRAAKSHEMHDGTTLTKWLSEQEDILTVPDPPGHGQEGLCCCSSKPSSPIRLGLCPICLRHEEMAEAARNAFLERQRRRGC